MEQIRSGLETALGSDSIVRGWRAQALFASTVVALDGCVMMTQVDLGEFYVDGDEIKAPDFFLHLRDGKRILVDVKSVDGAPETPEYIQTFGASHVRRLRRFGQLYGAEVYLAFYFSYHPLWLLISLDDLTLGPGGGFRITFADAFVNNKMSILGDRLVGAPAPLELQLLSDPSEPSGVTDGKARLTVSDFKIRAGGREVLEEHPRQVALFLMMHGDWEESQYIATDEARVISVTIEKAPADDDDPTRYPRADLIGALSTMYARLFEVGTSGPDGPTGLELKAEPGMLVSLIPHDYESAELPLVRLEVLPDPEANG